MLTACHHPRFRTTSSMRLYRWIGNRGRSAPATPASCDLRASISAAESTKANSSARLPIMAEMVLASSEVRRPAPT